MVGFDGKRLNADLRSLIESLRIGGMILFAVNLETPEQIRALCRDAQAFARRCGLPPLLVAVDQEGGQVARLRAPFTRFPGNPAMTGEADAGRFARITAAELHSVGINMNLAPVMDVDREEIEGVMAKRAFGSDPDRVSRLGCTVIDTLQKNRIMAVAKHFPGIGRTTLDSHLDQPFLETPARELATVDFLPFKAAIACGVAGIMLSHIRYSDLDDRWPASLSERIVKGLLRRQMAYDGVVMTDDLDMGAIFGHYDIDTVMARILLADVDLALICHKGPGIQRGFDTLKKHIGTSEKTREQARNSARRILSLKKKFLTFG
jgi:beta-N-acetylhexosaminidase